MTAYSVRGAHLSLGSHAALCTYEAAFGGKLASYLDRTQRIPVVPAAR